VADTGGRRFAVEDVPVGSWGRNLADDSFEGLEGNGGWRVPLRINPKAGVYVIVGVRELSLGEDV
jgi:hypothetical protein